MISGVGDGLDEDAHDKGLVRDVIVGVGDGLDVSVDWLESGDPPKSFACWEESRKPGDSRSGELFKGFLDVFDGSAGKVLAKGIWARDWGSDSAPSAIGIAIGVGSATREECPAKSAAV